MVNYWLLEIDGLLFGIRGGGFLLRPHLGASPLRSGFPPAHPSCGELDGDFWLKPVQASRQSLNKFRNSLSPIPKYSKQINHSNVLLFQIINL